jgi:hypothetical protein
MDMLFSFLGFLGDGDGIIQILWFMSFILFVVFGQKLMMTQTIWKVEKDVAEMEILAKEARRKVEHAVTLDRKGKQKVLEFMDFFIVSPVSTDPYGVMKKIDHVIRNSDRKFTALVNEIAPDLNIVEKMNFKNSLAGAMTTHQIAKAVRHMLELIKKYKMLQLAMILQMQIPMIKEFQKAAGKATEAFIQGTPIGDGMGPLVAASLVPKNIKPRVDKSNEFCYAKVKIAKKTVIVCKANGPGATTGYPGRFLTDLTKQEKITKIITVDAALKMEGEKSGIVREGVGIAMGGSGADRFEIENFSVRKGLPLDAIAIKMSNRQALEAMDKILIASIPEALDKVKNIVKKSKGKVLIMGVGNTCGVGNNIASVPEALVNVRKNSPKKKKKKKRWFDFLRSK